MTKATPSIKVPGITNMPYGQNVTLYEEGTTLYSKLRTDGPITLVLDDGTKVEAHVNGISVGPLIDLLINTGPTSIHTMGRIYSPLTVIQRLTDAKTAEGPLDVTALYMAVTVSVPMPMPQPGVP